MLTARGWIEISSAGATVVAQTTKDACWRARRLFQSLSISRRQQKNPARWPGLVNDINSWRFFRAAVIPACLGILVRTRIARWRVPILWSLVGTLLWLRDRLFQARIMALARVRRLLAGSRIRCFRSVVVVNHHFLPSVAQGLRLLLRDDPMPASAIRSTSGT